MKKAVLFFILMFALFSARGQTIDSLGKPIPEANVYTSVEKTPEFPGGNSALIHFLKNNLKYPGDARTAQKQGVVYVVFIIEKDGTVSNVRVTKPVFPSLDAEAIRVVNDLPKWKPAIQNGMPVRVILSIPISFKL